MTTAVLYPVESHGICPNVERDRNPALEANNAQTRNEVVAPRSTLRKISESSAVTFEPFDIRHGPNIIRTFRNEQI